MTTEQCETGLFSIVLHLDGNRISFAKDLCEADVDKMVTELEKTVVGKIEIIPGKIPPPVVSN